MSEFDSYSAEMQVPGAALPPAPRRYRYLSAEVCGSCYGLMMSRPARGAPRRHRRCLRRMRPGLVVTVRVTTWAGRPAPADLARMHLDVRRWQERVGQKRFPDIRDSQADLGDPDNYYVRPGGNLFIASAERTVAGFVGLRHLGNRTGQVKRLAVRPDFHRRGIARSLMSELVEWACANGFRRLILHTNRGERARSLYGSLGFLPVDFIGTSGDWVMEKEI